MSLAPLRLRQLRRKPWPQRPVKVIVPFVAGGNTDSQARIVSERLAAALGQAFVVENRVGAGGANATSRFGAMRLRQPESRRSR